MKNINIVGILLLLPFLWVSCKEDDHSFGDITAPTNIETNFDIVGVDTENPNGDGSGLVNFTVTANNAISYRIDFGDGKSDVSPSGQFQHRYTKVGINTYTAVISGIGTGGAMSSVPKELKVYSSFTDVEAENMLAGETVGDSKTWYWAADVSGYAGLGPQEADYGNGDFAYPAWWQSTPFDATRTCMFENSFVFSRTSDGVTFEQTADYVFVPGAYAGVLGVDGDNCVGTDAIPSITGVKTVSFFPSSSKAATEGSFNNEPYRGTAFELSDNGMLGWYVGASIYDIISLTESTLIVRVMQPNSEFAWYHIFTTTKPKEDAFTNLVWSDEFDADGAPDASKWTYDLGTGTNGWGNNELQTYTEDAENVSIADGVLKITAKTDGNGGYTSARIKTQGLYDFKYGKVEVKAKLPVLQGTWPALWILGSNIDTEGWPKCGEIDIMEQKGDDKGNVLATSHWLNAADNQNASYSLTTAVENASTEFHIYALEWTEDAIKIYVDDVKYYEMANSSELPFNQNYFLIFNVAMGGTLGGTVAANFTEDAMEIDYVRIYQ